MKLVSEQALDWGGTLSHRSGGVLFKDLLVGEDGPDNYLLALVKIDDRYSTPRHRHNFDQVRFMLKGGFGYGEQTQQEGSIGYFGEGTTYEQKSMGPNIHLLLQCANASRAAYFGRETLRRGNHELQQIGSFESGVFSRADAEGRVHRKDGFEAVWEHLAGEPVRYQQPRYERPIILYPDRFAAIPAVHTLGVQRTHLASFSERRLSLSMIDIAAGASVSLGDSAQRSLFYALSGEGAAGAHAVSAGSAIGLEAGEAIGLNATDGMRLLEILLPL